MLPKGFILHLEDHECIVRTVSSWGANIKHAERIYIQTGMPLDYENRGGCHMLLVKKLLNDVSDKSTRPRKGQNLLDFAFDTVATSSSSIDPKCESVKRLD
jgi:hypothetical protein